MSFRPPDGPPFDGPPPELTTTRVAGGGSARLVAVVVAGVLVAVVGFTIVNRPAPAAQQLPTSPEVAAGPTAAPTPTPARNNITGDDGFLGGIGPGGNVRTVRPADVQDFGFAALIQMTGGDLNAALKLDSVGLYQAKVVIPSAGLGRTLPIEIGRVGSQSDEIIYEPFGLWSMRLKALRKSRAGLVTMLVKVFPPDAMPDVPGAPTSGYAFTVMGYRDGASFDLILDLWIFLYDYSLTGTGPTGSSSTIAPSSTNAG